MHCKILFILCALAATSCGRSNSATDGDTAAASQPDQNATAAAENALAAAESDMVAQTLRNAEAAASSQQAHVDQIDSEMSALAGHQGEDPARMDALIKSCQDQLGVQMEGAGAYAITKCVNRRWSEVGDLTDAARSAGYDEPTSRRLGEQAAAICNGDPDCLR